MSNSYFLIVLVPLLGENNNEKAIAFMQQKGLLQSGLVCPRCSVLMLWMKRSQIRDKFKWKCINKNCTKYKTTFSIRIGSLFNGVSTSFDKIIFSIYKWAVGTSVTQACEEVDISRPTMILVYSYLREICRRYFAASLIRLGGPGIVCQIDESLFAYKPKYHQGRAMGVWHC
jgi:hypothetical protein